MEERKTAYFVRFARTLQDLKVAHLLNKERPYEIIKTVGLGPLDYENFTTDLLADRAFLEDFPQNRQDNGEYQCVFVHRYGRKDGILVVPTLDAHVESAAFVRFTSLPKQLRKHRTTGR